MNCTKNPLKKLVKTAILKSFIHGKIVYFNKNINIEPTQMSKKDIGVEKCE